jgi:hypothetical protein
MEEIIHFFVTPPNSPWEVLAIWLYLRAPQKLHEKLIYHKKIK